METAVSFINCLTITSRMSCQSSGSAVTCLCGGLEGGWAVEIRRIEDSLETNHYRYTLCSSQSLFEKINLGIRDYLRMQKSLF